MGRTTKLVDGCCTRAAWGSDTRSIVRSKRTKKGVDQVGIIKYLMTTAHGLWSKPEACSCLQYRIGSSSGSGAFPACLEPLTSETSSCPFREKISTFLSASYNDCCFFQDPSFGSPTKIVLEKEESISIPITKGTLSRGLSALPLCLSRIGRSGSGHTSNDTSATASL